MLKRNFQTGVLEAPATFSLVLPDEHTPDAANIVRGVKVFRVGTHTDSRGRKATWTHAQLQTAVDHFNLLKSNGILPNVPVREDHTTTVKDLVGWYQAIRLEGDFLVADIEFTEPTALDKYNRGTYRNKSIEIGAYETGDGTVYAPVVLGLAFVDIPAVEGLFRHPSAPQGASGDQSPAAPANHQGATMTTANTGTPTPADAAGEGTPTTPPTPATPPPPASPPPSTPTPSVTEPVATHQRPAVQTFRINGADVSDFAAVQAHITTLETFRTEAIESGRTDFVKSLATGNKIGAAQVDSFSKLVKTMTDEQFTEFKAGFEAAPANNLFAKHDTSGAGGNGAPADPENDRATEIEILQEIVQNHRRRGASDEEVARTASFKKLQTLTGKPA